MAAARAAHDCAWLGEETGRRGSLAGDAWVVDPLDGTADFLAGRRGSAVSVALLRNHQPVLGVVFAPLAPDDDGDLIAWAEGLPVTRNGADVHAAAAGQGFITLGLNAHAADRAQRNHEQWPGVRIRALPSPAYPLLPRQRPCALECPIAIAGYSLIGGMDLPRV